MFKKLAVLCLLTTLGYIADAQASGRVCFFEDMDYRKASFCLVGGQVINNLHDMGFWNDRISAVSVEGNLAVNMCTDSQFRGACTTIYDSISNMWVLGANWNDTVSSISVTDNDYYQPQPVPQWPGIPPQQWNPPQWNPPQWTPPQPDYGPQRGPRHGQQWPDFGPQRGPQRPDFGPHQGQYPRPDFGPQRGPQRPDFGPQQGPQQRPDFGPQQRGPQQPPQGPQRPQQPPPAPVPQPQPAPQPEPPAPQPAPEYPQEQPEPHQSEAGGM